ncbi:uncharacterized protein M421DRAFT_209597 [Didymella exigua CBS 183.55]|uniref:Uncharacterized protein n=1 Tax=Didymella exigua CBS 183.55 TaxID=1150837 RepID=A0A6A5RGB1_9PLEO|nr:uncharacterized protein M421DRAFT_209597 [Didymella exigua CBS 183.55]KAF1926549.1 hypothetical protein M421DRAFT_209597 [Didymella exigua CBS 183.55]
MQEMFLARHTTVWLDGIPMALEFLQAFQDYIFKGPYAAALPIIKKHNPHSHGFHLAASSGLESIDLIALLDRFSDKACADPRDRVFSLLSLCSTHPPTFLVDYGMSICCLSYSVLSAHPKPLCPCSITFVTRALRFPTAAPIEDVRHILAGPWAEFEFQHSPSKASRFDAELLELFGNCDHYGHCTSRIALHTAGVHRSSAKIMPGGSGRRRTVRIALWLLSSCLRPTYNIPIGSRTSAPVRLGWGEIAGPLRRAPPQASHVQ